MRSFIICTLYLILSGDQMKENEIEYVAHMGEMPTKFESENLKGRVHLEDLGINGRIILDWILWK